MFCSFIERAHEIIIIIIKQQSERKNFPFSCCFETETDIDVWIVNS